MHQSTEADADVIQFLNISKVAPLKKFPFFLIEQYKKFHTYHAMVLITCLQAIAITNTPLLHVLRAALQAQKALHRSSV